LARGETLRQQYYLNVWWIPRPDEPALPHRLKIILTVLGATLCFYFVAWMFVVGILEHAPEVDPWPHWHRVGAFRRG
jgi:capsular polysaccharide transport system permease protein